MKLLTCLKCHLTQLSLYAMPVLPRLIENLIKPLRNIYTFPVMALVISSLATSPPAPHTHRMNSKDMDYILAL